MSQNTALILRYPVSLNEFERAHLLIACERNEFDLFQAITWQQILRSFNVPASVWNAERGSNYYGRDSETDSQHTSVNEQEDAEFFGSELVGSGSRGF